MKRFLIIPALAVLAIGAAAIPAQAADLGVGSNTGVSVQTGVIGVDSTLNANTAVSANAHPRAGSGNDIRHSNAVGGPDYNRTQVNEAVQSDAQLHAYADPYNTREEYPDERKRFDSSTRIDASTNAGFGAHTGGIFAGNRTNADFND